MVKIISDSTCDLSADLVNRSGIQILPLHVLLGDTEYLDGMNITPNEIFAWADANKATPKTSAVSMDEAMKAMRPLLDDGHELICFTISSKMSATCQNLRLAAKELNAEDKVTVIDSRNLSTGIGLMVLEAADMAQQGADRATIVSHINTLVPRVRSSFVVDTLTYLHRGGRCSGLAALAGGALRLHPRINVTEGVMGPAKKYRGRMNRVLPEYAQDLQEELLRADPKRVFITHSIDDPALVQQIHQQLEDLHHFKEIVVINTGSVISSHCGPGTLGILFIGE